MDRICTVEGCNNRRGSKGKGRIDTKCRVHSGDRSRRKIIDRRHQEKVRKIRIREMKEERLAAGCVDCSITDRRVLNFDHRNPSEKLFNIGTGFGHSIKSIIAELNKCDVVCRNCHAIRGYERKQDAAIEAI